MIKGMEGPILKRGDLVKCNKKGWLYRVTGVLAAVEGLTLERYRLEIVERGALRRGAMQDIIARRYFSERYRVPRRAV